MCANPFFAFPSLPPAPFLVINCRSSAEQGGKVGGEDTLTSCLLKQSGNGAHVNMQMGAGLRRHTCALPSLLPAPRPLLAARCPPRSVGAPGPRGGRVGAARTRGPAAAARGGAGQGAGQGAGLRPRGRGRREGRVARGHGRTPVGGGGGDAGRAGLRALPPAGAGAAAPRGSDGGGERSPRCWQERGCGTAPGWGGEPRQQRCVCQGGSAGHGPT